MLDGNSTRKRRSGDRSSVSGPPVRESADHPGIQGLGDVLDRIRVVASTRERVSIADAVEQLGQRSFAPLLLVAGLIILAPIIGDVPGVPVLMGLVVILVCGQLVVGRDRVWLPDWLLRRAVNGDKVEKVVSWLHKPAAFVDRWTRCRYTRLLRQGGTSVIAIACILIAAATPMMELVPFSANIAGIAITAFAVALIAGDGLVALGAIMLVIAATGLVAWQFV